MRVLVAAQASLLLLNRPAGTFPNLREVLVYPGAFVVRRDQRDAAGLVSEGRRVLSGESWQRGQVILSWDDVVAGAASPTAAAGSTNRRLTTEPSPPLTMKSPKRSQTKCCRGKAARDLRGVQAGVRSR